MRVFIAVVVVFLIAVYGFQVDLPTGSGTLRIHSGIITDWE